MAEREIMYGVFPGGDPRDFKPDEECCSPEEIAAWKAACEEWERGEGVDRGPGCSFAGDGSVHDGTGFGIGTYYIEVEDPWADLSFAEARIATLDSQVTVLREALETLATSLRLNQPITDVEKFARRMLAEADAAALKEPSEPPCRCSPGDTCICAYDCSCRAEFKHAYDSDEGWSNEGPAAALKETKGN